MTTDSFTPDPTGRAPALHETVTAPRPTEPTTPAARPEVTRPSTTGRRRRIAGIAAGVTALAAAVGVAVWGTPSDDTPMAAGGGGHNHGARAAGGARGMPVALTAAQAARIGVTYAVAERVPLRREIRTVGQITFDETRLTTISPRIEGWVERLHVNATGQPITAGAPLLSVYAPMLVSAQEELLLARRLASDMRDGSPEARRSAEELIASARRRLAYWDVPPSEIAAVERSGQVRRALTLQAPSSGYVVEKLVTQGQRIMPGDVLYRVADLRTVWVEGEVFEQDLPAVRVGEMVHVDLQALPGQHFMGRIAYVYPTLNPETRTARVRVELANGRLQLKPGMYATIRVEGAAGAGQLSVPRAAVLVTGERSLVFVRGRDGRLVPRDVRLGVTTDERVEILAGLAAGDTVVASATFLIDAESNLGSALGGMGDMPGMDVRAPVPPPAAPSAPAPSPATPPGTPPPPPPATRGATPPATPAPTARPDPHAGHGAPGRASGTASGSASGNASGQATHTGHER